MKPDDLPELVFLLFDTGHLVFSDIDAEAVLIKYAKRIKHVHLKDIRKDILEQVKKEDWSFLKAICGKYNKKHSVC